MVTLEWDVPFILSTPQGDLSFNTQAVRGTTPVGYYLLDSSACSAGAGPRVTRTNVSQAPGEIPHRKFRTGYTMQLSAQLWEVPGVGGKPACASVLRDMGDYLMLFLNSIENTDGRIRWAPSGAPERMLDRVRLLGPSADGGGGAVTVQSDKDSQTPLTTVSFALLTPFPYAQDYTEIDTVIADGGTTALTNLGNVDFYPVFRVHGPTSAFTLKNNSVLDSDGNALAINYDGLLPGAQAIGGGHYAEIDTFRNTVYLDGNSSNLKPGINILFSDFWWLQPGVNNVEIQGASVDVLWQSAWA